MESLEYFFRTETKTFRVLNIKNNLNNQRLIKVSAEGKQSMLLLLAPKQTKKIGVPDDFPTEVNLKDITEKGENM